MRPSRCRPTARALLLIRLNDRRLRTGSRGKGGRDRAECEGQQNEPRTSLQLDSSSFRRLAFGPPSSVDSPLRLDPRPTAILPLSTRRDEALLGLRIEEVKLVRRDRELDVVADLHLPVARNERQYFVSLGVRV